MHYTGVPGERLPGKPISKRAQTCAEGPTRLREALDHTLQKAARARTNVQQITSKSPNSVIQITRKTGTMSLPGVI
jgi:hypothetical protein